MDGHHKYLYDEENLILILERKGFRNVRLRNLDPSLDLKTRDFESIYVEAQKQEVTNFNKVLHLIDIMLHSIEIGEHGHYFYKKSWIVIKIDV